MKKLIIDIGDFALSIYQSLIKMLIESNYNFFTLEEYFSNPNSYSQTDYLILIRHDVDRKPQNALAFAEIEYLLGVKSVYYFRVVPESFNSELIRSIASLGYEIGYHYENINTWHGDVDKAWDDFRRNLEKLRKLYPVKTICMHGSPLSKYDNRDLWKKYDYQKEGIIGELYLDVDWNDIYYLTDTGRRWDGGDVSIRDKVESSKPESIRDSDTSGYKVQSNWPVYHSTNDIIGAIENSSFPKKVMITTHPQRWTDNPILWTRELVAQNIKNVVKRMMVTRKQRQR